MSNSKTVRIYQDWHDQVPAFCRAQTAPLDTDFEVPEELYKQYIEATNKLIELEGKLIEYRDADRA